MPSDTCASCGKSREQLKKEKGTGFKVLGMSNDEDWQVCDFECMRAWCKDNR